MGTYQLDDSGDYMTRYPAGATALLLGLLCITAIPPSGMFISELYLFKAMVQAGRFIPLLITALLLCFVLYALLTRVLHIVFSHPREEKNLVRHNVNPWQTVTQFILFGVVIFVCFIQPDMLRQLIYDIISVLPK
jgi:hydrogenase-4 component F